MKIPRKTHSLTRLERLVIAAVAVGAMLLVGPDLMAWSETVIRWFGDLAANALGAFMTAFEEELLARLDQ